MVWNRITGKPLHHAIVWLDSRTSDLAREYIEKTPTNHKDFFKKKTGLPIHPYFSALKLNWLLKNVGEVQKALKEGEFLRRFFFVILIFLGTLMFGTVDSWLLWKFIGKHITDVTNASRTLLLDLHKQKWSSELCTFFDIPIEILPKIRSSAEIYGYINAGEFFMYITIMIFWQFKL